MNKIIILISSFCVMGCVSLKKKPSVPPSVSTVQVIQSLNDTKSELNEAGIANSKVAANIDKALTLAEKLETLLAQIEKEQAILANKNIIKPIK